MWKPEHQLVAPVEIEVGNDGDIHETEGVPPPAGHRIDPLRGHAGEGRAGQRCKCHFTADGARRRPGDQPCDADAVAVLGGNDVVPASVAVAVSEGHEQAAEPIPR